MGSHVETTDLTFRAFPEHLRLPLTDFLAAEAPDMNRLPADVGPLYRELIEARAFVAATAEGMRPADVQVLGFAALHPHGSSRASEHVASLRLQVGAQARGLGLGTRLMERILEQAETLGIRRIVATPYLPEPEAWGKVEFFRRFGFKVEGVAREGARLLDGSYTDVALMARVQGTALPKSAAARAAS